jgi:hypothetical protein
MRYIKLVSTFSLPNGNDSTLCTYQKCLDAEYQKTIDDSVIINRVTAKRMCGDIEPIITHSITDLTNAEFNAAVLKAEDFTEDISALADELNSQDNPFNHE